MSENGTDVLTGGESNLASAMTWEEVLAEAVRLQRAGDGPSAEALYDALLRDQPEQPDVLHFLGILRHQQDRNDEAVRLISRALDLVPEYVDAWNNLGNILLRSDRWAEAEQAYRRALALNDQHPGAWNNLAMILTREKSYEEAIAAHKKVIELLPEAEDAYYNFANTLRALGDLDAAIAGYRMALQINPAHARANTAVAYLLYLAGKRGDGIRLAREWLEMDPQNPLARHLLASFTQEEVPDRASADYVRITFDNFAEGFDSVLGELDYKAPQHVGAALAREVGSPRGDLHILDAGCGTGLCAQHVRGFAKVLEGVDLSTRMLAKANARGLYDQLYESELTSFMDANPQAWNAIISADVLIYIGDLDPVAKAAFKALRPGGWFVFSTEGVDGDGYVLGPSGRYAHSEIYLRRVLGDAGFRDIDMDLEFMRKESGMLVNGYVVRAHAVKAEEAVG
jgi:predicted TPR repeat methyltransferase